MEIWKPVVGYEGHYEVSNLGRVRSVPKVLSPWTNNSEYQYVTLKVAGINDGKKRNRSVHSLVAEAFVENPEGLREVNHKNEIKDDNRSDNLEWATRQYNCNYGERTEKFRETHRRNGKMNKAVIQRTMDGEFIARHRSMKDAAEAIGGTASCISNVIAGRNSHHMNFKWEYDA